jgi:GT2 family glycosyltransferase
MSTRAESELPPATVVIPTRDRGDDVVRTLRSILAGTFPPALVIVSDQSRDDATAAALAPLLGDPRIRHLRTSTSGISAALNQGIENAASDCIAITGDDCEATPSWLAELVGALTADSSTGVVFGTARPGNGNKEAGFTPSYAAQNAVARNIRQKHLVTGTSQCMALRRSAWERLGGFDEMLGVGSPLRSAEETDFTIRALLAGYAARETPRAEVIHHGYYTYQQRRLLIRRNWYGTGAAFAKALRLGRLEMLDVFFRVGVSWARGSSRVAAGLGTGAYRFDTMTAFLKGAWTGLRLPVDRDRGRFVVKSSDNAAAFSAYEP